MVILCEKNVRTRGRAGAGAGRNIPRHHHRLINSLRGPYEYNLLIKRVRYSEQASVSFLTYQHDFATLN